MKCSLIVGILILPESVRACLESNNNSLCAALSDELDRERGGERERELGVNRGNRGDISDSLDIVHVTADS